MNACRRRHQGLAGARARALRGRGNEEPCEAIAQARPAGHRIAAAGGAVVLDEHVQLLLVRVRPRRRVVGALGAALALDGQLASALVLHRSERVAAGAEEKAPAGPFAHVYGRRGDINFHNCADSQGRCKLWKKNGANSSPIVRFLPRQLRSSIRSFIWTNGSFRLLVGA